MTLRTFARICFWTSLLSFMVLATLGYQGLRNMSQEQQRLQILERLENQIHDMNLAVDYVTLLRPDPRILESLRSNLQQAREGLKHLQIADSRRTLLYLDEADYLLDHLHKLVTRHALETDRSGFQSQMTPLTQQLRAHSAGADAAVRDMLRDVRRQAGLSVEQMTLLLGILLLLFIALALMTAALISRRILHPLTLLDHGIQKMAEGCSGVRIDLRGHHELAHLVHAFNEMAAARDSHEKKLAESEQKFRQITESIGEVFWMRDPDFTQWLHVSAAFETIWGSPVAQLYAKPNLWFEQIHPDDRRTVRKAMGVSRQGGCSLEYRVIRPDGTWRWVADSAFPVLDANGRVIQVVGVARDVTARRLAESQLQERIKELNCLNRVLDLTTENDDSSTSVFAQICDVIKSAVRKPELAVAQISIGGVSTFSSHWQTPVVSISSKIVVDSRAEGEVVLGYVADLQGEYDDEAPFLPEEKIMLEGISRHISRMLQGRKTAERLAQSQRLEVAGQLVGGVAHDFNNLLTVILGNGELLQERVSADDTALAESAAMISSAATRGAQLTQRLLAFARRQPLEPCVVDINGLVGGMESLLCRTLGENIRVEIVRGAGLWAVRADPGQLENALLNLAINARDAMPEGGRLTIETGNVWMSKDYADFHYEVVPGQYVMVAVSDTGEGISAGNLAKIFEPFFTTKGAGKGTGLGLSMVFGFVKQSRGHIKAYSEPGQGTTIRIYLPRETEQEVAVIHERLVTEAETGHEHILLVEDDAMVRRYALEALLSLGYQVTEACDGQEAVAIVREGGSFDLLFTDVVLPGGMNGRELAEVLDRLQPGLPVLYTSGYTENAIIHHGRLDAGLHLLSKPYRKAELARSIREVLGFASRSN